MTPLDEQLRRAARDHPEALALDCAGTCLSYRELFDAASALAARLATLPDGAPVAILGQGAPFAYIGVLAAVLAGCPFVPVNSAFPEERQQMILDSAGAQAMVMTADQSSRGARLAGPGLLFTATDSGFIETGTARGGSSYPGMAYMMFTSGTTGRPKGVGVTPDNLLAYLDAIRDIAAIGPGDRASHFFDLSFDLAMHDLFVTWCAGASLIVPAKSENLAICDFARRTRLTHWFSVPTLAAFASRMGQLGPASLPDLKTVLFCGEPLPVSIARQVRDAAPHARHWNLYGPTEATIAFTAYEIRDDRSMAGLRTVPIGAPIGAGRTQLAPEAETSPFGELLLGGPQITPGYLGAPEQTARAFCESDGTRWYRSGDLVRTDDVHGLIFEGRRDDQVKINGYRIELAEVEAVLRVASGSAQVAAIPVAARDGAGSELHAFIAGSQCPAAAIRRACRASLPAYMVPRHVALIDLMPLTASGKVDRRALRESEIA